ncbi:MAG: GNAT family N-acetyltransferase [Eubacteriaceae bacterium]|nr:GNAT family N-acetyltransferase [Eubacteriaceae bacterium]
MINENDINIKKANRLDIIKLNFLCEEDDEWFEGIKIMANDLLSSYDEQTLCFIAFYNDEAIGFIFGFVLHKQTLYPQFMYVKDEFRKMGVGKQLMNALETQSGCKTSFIYYKKILREYFAKQGYDADEGLEIAVKML